jgi:hypothetical protein
MQGHQPALSRSKSLLLVLRCDVSFAVACFLPLVMLAMLFLLARIEERHLVARPARVAVEESGPMVELN